MILPSDAAWVTPHGGDMVAQSLLIYLHYDPLIQVIFIYMMIQLAQKMTNI